MKWPDLSQDDEQWVSMFSLAKYFKWERWNARIMGCPPKIAEFDSRRFMLMFHLISTS
jgi:hypothetical protein